MHSYLKHFSSSVILDIQNDYIHFMPNYAALLQSWAIIAAENTGSKA